MTVRPEPLLKELSRLRRLSREDARIAQELEPTIVLLTRLVGPTVKKAVAARTLGISQTALDKWIASNDIATARTPEGKTEVPIGEVLALLDDLPAVGDARRPISVALRRRRERPLAELGLDLLPWSPGETSSGHRRADLRSLAYHRAVARSLDQGKVSAARARLQRWREEGRIADDWAERWERVLGQPLTEIAATIGADTPEAADLRQSSPFAGTLDEWTRRALLRAVDASST